MRSATISDFPATKERTWLDDWVHCFRPHEICRELRNRPSVDESSPQRQSGEAV